jgi:hypothetical protein
MIGVERTALRLRTPEKSKNFGSRPLATFKPVILNFSEADGTFNLIICAYFDVLDYKFLSCKESRYVIS